MYPSRREAFKDRDGVYREQRQVPFSPKEIHNPIELVHWRETVEMRSMVKRAKTRERAISAFCSSKLRTDYSKALVAYANRISQFGPEYKIIEKSWLEQAYNSIVNFFLNIKFN